LDIIEAIYRIEQAEEPWLTDVIEAARPKLDEGFGLYAGSYDASDLGQVKYSSFVALGSFDREVALQAQLSLSATEVEQTITPCGTASQMLGAAFPHQALREFGHPLGVHDALGINAHDPSGFGVVMVVPLPKVSRLSPARGAVLGRIAAHLTAALRLRRRLETEAAPGADLYSRSEAVLRADGSIEHASGSASDRAARTALRKAAAELGRARGSMRSSEPERALAHWKGLVSARWSLIDRFEADGRRYLLAAENEPKPRLHAALSRREQQVVSFANLGHSNKLIAYELGIAHSTVKVLLSRAAAKLGASSREEVVRRFVERGARRPEP
jgi:DNA-binding CsgD family transcriptional regulator